MLHYWSFPSTNKSGSGMSIYRLEGKHILYTVVLVLGCKHELVNQLEKLINGAGSFSVMYSFVFSVSN